MNKDPRLLVLFLVFLAAFGGSGLLAAKWPGSDAGQEQSTNPFDAQVAEQIHGLKSETPAARAAAAEALGFLRAYSAADALVEALGDESPLVRREAAMSLAWCGGRSEINSLLESLHDQDWVVRQAAWGSLTNLTGMELPFDGRANAETRGRQADCWRAWCRAIPSEQPPPDVFALTADSDHEKRLRGARALGALGGRGAADEVIRVARPLLEQRYESLDPLEKHLVQSCLRSLGQLGDSEGQAILIGLLETAGWARYAADALGDYGGSGAVDKLIEVYPRFSRDLTDRRGKGNLRNPDICPADDRFSGNNTQDRMHETPFAVASALVRLPLEDPRHIAGLREIAPYLLANLPSDWDSGVLYQREAYEEVTAYLLERAGLRSELGRFESHFCTS